MKYSDQRKKMKMQSGGVAEDVAGGVTGFEQRLQQIGKFAEGIATEEDRGILEGILQSRQAQEFLTSEKSSHKKTSNHTGSTVSKTGLMPLRAKGYSQWQ